MLRYSNAKSSYDKDVFKINILNNGIELNESQFAYFEDKLKISFKDLNLNANQTEKAKKAIEIFYKHTRKSFYKLVFFDSCLLFCLCVCVALSTTRVWQDKSSG